MIDKIFSALSLIKDGFLLVRDNKTRLFSNYLEPAMKNIELVHNNYLETFAECMEIVQNGSARFARDHKVFEKMRKDSITSSGIREKLFSDYDHSLNSALKEFNGSVISYFNCLAESVDTDEEKMKIVRYNVVRHDLLRQLKSLADKQGGFDFDKKERAISLFERAIDALNYRYRSILDNYNYVKNDLLK